MFAMWRRQLITLLGGAAAACPISARAQQPARLAINLTTAKALGISRAPTR